MIIPARNVQANAKIRSQPWASAEMTRIRNLAYDYRHGRITADDIDPQDREPVQVYLLDHPKREVRLVTHERSK